MVNLTILYLNNTREILFDLLIIIGCILSSSFIGINVEPPIILLIKNYFLMVHLNHNNLNYHLYHLNYYQNFHLLNY